MWNKDEMQGKGESAKGKVKQAVGDLIDDERLKSEGEVDEAAGKIQHTYGTTRRKIGETVEDVGKKIRKS